MPSVRDEQAENAPTERELMLRVMREMEERLASKIADVRIEAVEEAKKSVRPPAAPAAPPAPPTQKTNFFQQLPAVLIATTGLVAALGALYKPVDTTKDEASYKALSAAVNGVASAQAARSRVEDERWRFTVGVFKGQGMRIIDPPGEEPIPPVELAPPPLNTKRSPSSAPAIQVRTLPPAAAPPPTAGAVTLPSPEKLFGKTP